MHEKRKRPSQSLPLYMLIFLFAVHQLLALCQLSRQRCRQQIPMRLFLRYSPAIDRQRPLRHRVPVVRMADVIRRFRLVLCHLRRIRQQIRQLCAQSSISPRRKVTPCS